MPYTSKEPTIANTNINIFSNGGMSQKIQFPYNEKTSIGDYNKKNRLLDFLRAIKESNKTSFLMNYFISIIDELTCLQYSMIDFIFNIMNQTFSEHVIIMFSPFLMPIMFFIISICGFLYSIYLWFIEMSWFFKVNENKNKDGPPKWETMSIMGYPIYTYIAVNLVFIFVFLFFIGGAMFLNVVLTITFIWSLISVLGYKGSINDKEVGIFNIIKDVLKYHKLKIMSLIAFFITLSAFINMGAIGGVVCLITIILLFFGIFIHSNVFKSSIPPGISKMVSYIQAAKVCNKAQPSNENKSFFSNITNFFTNKKGGRK
jgi:hypothetical protein